MKHVRTFALIGIASLLFAACGGGTSDAKIPLVGKNVKTALVPNPNGFAFANFASSASPEVFDAEDVVKMFGSTKDVCVDGATPCQLVAEAAAWVRMVNDARTSGHCEGFAVTSASRFTSSETPITAELANEGDVTHGIMRAFATQFLKEVQDDTKSWGSKSLREKIAALEESFANNQVSYSLGVYTNTGGHAVLPYALEYVTPTKVKIKVYDSNWPGKDRYVSVDLDSNTWSFAFSGADPANDPNMWSGGPKDLDLTSMKSRTSGTCPFCSSNSVVTNTMLLVRSSTLDWSIKTSNGTVSPSSTSAGDASVRPIRSATSGDAPADFMVSVPAGESISLKLPTAARVTGLTPTSVIQIDTPGSSSQDIVVSDNSVSSDDPNVMLTLADGNLVGASNGENNSLTTSGDQIEVNTTTSTGEVVKVEVNEESPAIEVRTGGNDVLSKGSDYEILSQIDENTIEKKSVTPNGDSKTTTIEGQLDSSKESIPMPKELEAPAVKDGLPSPDERVITDVSTTSASSTTAPATAQKNSNTPTLRAVAKPPQ